MKMIRAIVRPERAEVVASSLAAAGFPALTRMDVYGRGKQKGISFDSIKYEELPKSLLMIVVEDENVSKVTSIIQVSALTGYYGDGKILVTPVDTAYTIRTGEEGL
ncbi:MAG: P-II family nitrogen regulator [Chloroflexi bacterium]|uniref:P-II family nitrogen regulator n=1 Tax=Candidatus Chlorohelix allophototropha TaxID=3003348 RepID=A0A8T7M9Q7_9CHLR|nr:P-II family nitrogen regulator [Chloroflexota bacterium]WJW68690.1 P-II family nitrogen regulator [Chloroflexota bacterium L227-S17]